MAELFERMNEDIAYVQKLGDNPNSDNGFTAQDLKEWFDKAPLAIQMYLNNTFIPQVENKFGSIDRWIAEAGTKIDGFVVGTGFLPVDGSVAMSGNLDMGNKNIKNVANPISSNDAVNKEYADAIEKKADDAGTAAQNASSLANSKCKRNSFTVELKSSGWSGNYQIVTASGVLADEEMCDVLTSPAESSREIYNDCVVRCTAQGNNTLTFMCDDVPAENLTVGIIVLI